MYYEYEQVVSLPYIRPQHCCIVSFAFRVFTAVSCGSFSPINRGRPDRLFIASITLQHPCLFSYLLSLPPHASRLVVFRLCCVLAAVGGMVFRSEQVVIVCQDGATFVIPRVSVRDVSFRVPIPRSLLLLLLFLVPLHSSDLKVCMCEGSPSFPTQIMVLSPPSRFIQRLYVRTYVCTQLFFSFLEQWP